MAASKLGAEALAGAEELSIVWFARLAAAVLDAWPEHRETLAGAPSPTEALEELAAVLGTTATFERALSAPLTYLSRHSLYLRRDAKALSARSVSKAIARLADVVVYLCRLADAGRAARRGARVARQYYDRYFDHAAAHGVRPLWREPLDPSLSELAAEEGPGPGPGPAPAAPPQGKTIDWYKQNGWRDFLRGRVITPASGAYAGQRLAIIRYCGTSTLCESVATGERRLVGSKAHAVEWE